MSLAKILKDPKFWLEVIIFVLSLIKKGATKQEAVNKAANQFAVSPSEILKRMK
ncbi:hypothetical protein NST12_16950 [Bacillus sp. FSL W8-1127]|uniref:hypothetical protein n=1 Tax=Bacillus sp. FSL W8-1127 TaxID=2954710 RepID=UPI0030FAD93F